MRPRDRRPEPVMYTGTEKHRVVHMARKRPVPHVCWAALTGHRGDAARVALSSVAVREGAPPEPLSRASIGVCVCLCVCVCVCVRLSLLTSWGDPGVSVRVCVAGEACSRGSTFMCESASETHSGGIHASVLWVIICMLIKSQSGGSTLTCVST